MTSNAMKFSLVEWTTGADKGLWTTVETTCIRGYDRIFEWMKFDSDGKFIEGEGFPADIVVEWHTAGKKPDAGWPVHKAKIIQVSGNRMLLEEAIERRIRMSTASKESTQGKRKTTASKRMLEAATDVNPNAHKSRKVTTTRMGQFTPGVYELYICVRIIYVCSITIL